VSLHRGWQMSAGAAQRRAGEGVGAELHRLANDLKLEGPVTPTCWPARQASSRAIEEMAMRRISAVVEKSLQQALATLLQNARAGRRALGP